MEIEESRIKSCCKTLVECFDLNDMSPEEAVSAMVNVTGMLCAEYATQENFKELLSKLVECYKHHLGSFYD